MMSSRSPLHIAYLGHADNPHIERKWIPALLEQGVQISVISFRKTNTPIQGVSYYYLNPIGKTIRFYDFPLAVAQLRHYLSIIKPHITLASFALTYGLMGMLAKVRPLVVQTWSRDIAVPFSVNRREALMANTIGRFVLKYCDGITTDGKFFASFLNKKYPELESKILATPWGIKLDAYTFSDDDRLRARKLLNIPKNASVITSIRGLFWYYQPETVLEGLLLTLQRHSETFGIVMTGGYATNSATHALLTQLEATGRCRIFHEFVPTDIMRTVWACTDIFISCPLFDGVAESVEEGMAARAIPVLSPVGSNKELVADNAGFYTPSVRCTPIELQQCIDNALALPIWKKNELCEANRIFIEKGGNVATTALSLIHFLEEIATCNSAYNGADTNSHDQLRSAFLHKADTLYTAE